MSKISELSDGGVIQGGDTLIAVRSGGNVKVTYGGTTTANIDGGTIDNTVIGGTTPAAGNFTTGSFTADVSFGDNDKATFGAGSDLKLYHTGFHSYIDESGTGNLYIGSNNGAGVYIQGSGETLASFVDDGAATLYHDGLAKLATTTTGVDVTGTVTADGLTVDKEGTDHLKITDTSSSNTLTIGIGNTVGTIAIDPTNSVASSDLDFSVDGNTAIRIADGGDVSFYEDTGTTAKFLWSASQERLEIDSVNPNALRLERNGGTDANVSIEFNCATNDWYVGTNPANNFAIGTALDQTNAPFQIDSSGNVGIGTSSPSQEFHLRQTSGDCNLLIDSANGASQIFFGDDESVNVGNIRYDHASNYMRFSTNSSEAMRISSDGSCRWTPDGTNPDMTLDASGNLLVGTTEIDVGYTDSGAGCMLGPEGTLQLARSSANANLYLNKLDNDGEIINFRKDGLTVGSIGTRAGDLFVGTGNTKLRFDDASDAIHAGGGDGSGTNAGTDLGTNTYKFGDLYLSGGVYLGGTGSANHLDDYEEGTFTPVFADASTGGNTATVGNADGWYTKVGNLVSVSVRLLDIDTSGMTSSNAVFIRGLPFTSSSTSVANMGSVLLDRVNFTGYVAATQVANTSYILLQNMISGAQDANILVSAVTATGSDVLISLQYKTS